MQKTFNYLDKNAAKNVAYEIKKMINKDCVLLFIGTDKSIGDAFAPLVGSLLESYNLLKNPIFGTIKHPVHALNINDTVELSLINISSIVELVQALAQQEQLNLNKIYLFVQKKEVSLLFLFT